MNPSELRVALVGCGGVVRRYRRAYARLPGVSVVAAIDVNRAEAQTAAAETGGGRASAAFEDALAAEVDVAVISTPNHLHEQQAVAALRAGKHVLLQKPMARTTAECDAILAAARESRAALGIYMNLLDHPLFHDLRRMVESGYLGRVGLFSARLAHRGGLAWAGRQTNWRASRDITGGGSYIQLAVHYQHLMRWLLGARVARVQAFARNLACPQLEGDDLMLAHYDLDTGAFGEIQTSWCLQEEHVSLLGTRGSIHYRDNRRVEYIGEGGPFEGGILKLQGKGEMEVLDPCLPPEWDDADNPHNQHRAFLEALRDGRAPEVPGEEGREDVRIVRACYQSVAEEKAVTL